ncbi:uncharacterized protein LOC121641830 isoform X2 [Melanotaenia boesemani]|uniref:uncharacterized protein LOC121641830 isoform X1 n=1 Tax=Melanotaenia boesemani TaxID=1250792 RepID=UPI001C0474AE|nr:uncharacterized protein LOC121641830 isoform X1 [Melanotaenia boesemani]XP_041844095.1 uncharacterized protein LOC121641830 isoform X2 [Melanotaenia boesemani]
MLVFVWIFWRMFQGSLGGPVPRQVWSEEAKSMNAAQLGASRPSFYRLPVFLHAPGPLVPPELFRPVPIKTAVPAGLTPLLIPSTEQRETGRDTGARAVDVWCEMDTITVRVDRFQLRAWTVPTQFRLGSCEASRVTPHYLFFHYSLMECGGDMKVVGGQLVYTFLMTYDPPPQDFVIRVFPLHLPIHCHYNRFHYSYQVGFRPQIQQTTFQKSLRSKLMFSLTVCNAQWEPLPPGHTFFLGEQVYFLAQAGVLLAGERLYVDWCYATSYEDSSSSPRVDVISNHGCMMDSRREGSSSQFLSGGGAVLMFSVDAFLFRGVSQAQYLHCSLSVGLEATHTAKSCSYNKATGRWEELVASSSVCSCCDSLCAEEQTTFKNRVRSSGWFVGQKDEEKIELEERDFPAEEEKKLVDQKEGRKNRMDLDHKDQETRTGNQEDEDAATNRKDWKMSVVEQQETAEQGGGEGVEESASQLKEPPSYGIMSDESGPQKYQTALDEDSVPFFKSYFATGSSGDDGGDVSGILSAPQTNHSSTGDISTTATTPVCSHVSCSSARGGVQSASGGSGTQHPVQAASASRGFPPANAEPGGHVYPKKDQTRSSGADTAFWSKWIQCGHKPASDNADTSDEDSGGLEFKHLICAVGESGSGSPHRNRSSGEGKAQEGVSSSEEVQETRRGHSAVVVTTSWQDSDRNQMTELVPELGLQSLGFVVMQPAEVDRDLRRRLFFSRLDGEKQRWKD